MRIAVDHIIDLPYIILQEFWVLLSLVQLICLMTICQISLVDEIQWSAGEEVIYFEFP